MANELHVDYTGTDSLYAIVRRVSDGKVWDVTNTEWATWADGSIGDYDIAMSSLGGDLYAADMPSAIATGTMLRITYYEQAGDSPATDDLVIGKHTGNWTGTISDGDVGELGAGLITVARAQQHPQLTTVDETILGVYVAAASAAVVTWCSREFAQDTFTETYDGDGTNEIVLDQFPVESITSCTITDDDDTDYDIDADEFRIDTAAAIVRFKPSSTADYNYFPSGFRNVQFVYTAGYATVPEDVQSAVAQVAAGLYGTDSRDGSVASETMGDYAYTVNTAADADSVMTPFARRVLARYRDIKIGR